MSARPLPSSPDPARHPSRRWLLGAGGAGLLAVPLTGCDLLSTAPSGKDADTGGSAGEGGSKPGAGAPANGKEAPALAAKVKSGALPPVEKRMPDEPLVIKPTKDIGRYGGTWHSWMQGLAAVYVIVAEVGYEGLVRWKEDWSDPVPNLAASWEIGGAGREYTIRLRPGTRWSDGEPFTADDLVFAHEDILADKEISPIPDSLIAREGKAGSIEKLDDHTVRFTFDPPHGLFLQLLAGPGGLSIVRPRHYLEQFHKKYNDKVADLAKKEGFSTWVELFGSKNDGSYQNPDMPVLNAWQVTKPVAGGSGQGVYDRNPYYWKTDTEGSQLPYLDRVAYQLIQKTETALLDTMNGDIDFNHPTFTGGVCLSQNKPVLARNRDQGGYGFVDSTYETMNWMVLLVNLNHKEPVLRDLFQNKDFRIGLSHAINRKDIIDTVYQRQGEPWQASPRKESAFFDEEMAKQYTEYDKALAGKFLDRAGVAQRDRSGFRLRPDGKRLSFTVEVVTEQPDHISNLELIKANWKDVGVEISIRSEDRTLFGERIQSGANLHDAAVWTGDGGYGDELLNPYWYMPFDPTNAARWGDWYNSGGEEGERPPAVVRRQMSLYDKVKSTSDKGEQQRLYKELLAIAKEQFWCIGISLSVGAYGTVKSDFHNVPGWIPAAYSYPSPGPTRPEQYYLA